jgi:hypothetical protein
MRDAGRIFGWFVSVGANGSEEAESVGIRRRLDRSVQLPGEVGHSHEVDYESPIHLYEPIRCATATPSGGE